MARPLIANVLKEARKAIDLKDYETALKHCRQVLESDPKNYTALLFSGISYANLDPPQIQKSEQSYKDAIVIDRNNPLAWQGLVDLYSKTGDWKQLVEVCRRVLELLGQNHPKARNYEMKLAYGLHQSGQLKEAKECYRTLIKNENAPNVALVLHTALVAVLESEEQQDTQLLLHDLATQRQLQLPPTSLETLHTLLSSSSLRPLYLDVERQILARHHERSSVQIDDEYEALLHLSQRCLTNESSESSQSSSSSSSLPSPFSSVSPLEVLTNYSLKLLQRLHRRLTFHSKFDAQSILERLVKWSTHLMIHWPTISPGLFVNALELLHRDDACLSWQLIVAWAQRGVHQFPHHSLLWVYLVVCWVHTILPRPAVVRLGNLPSSTTPHFLPVQSLPFLVSPPSSQLLLSHAMYVLSNISTTALPLAGWYALARLYLHHRVYMRAFECAKQGLDVWKNNPPEHAASLSAYWRALHLVLAASLYHNRQSAAALKTCEQVLDMDSQDLEALLLSAEIHFYTHTYQKSKEFYLRVKAQRGDELLASSGYAVESHWIRGRCVWLEALDLIHRLERGYVHLLREGVERLVILSDHHNRTSTEDAQRDELINRFGLALSKDELFFLDGLLQILEEVTVALEHNNNRPNLLTNGLENDDTRLLEVLVLRSRLLWILQRHASAKPLLMRAVQLGEHFQESLSPHLEEVLARAWCLLGQWYWYHGQEKAEHDWRTHAKKCWLKSLTLYPGSDAVADYDAGLLFVRCCLTEGTPSELQHVQSVLSELHDRRHVIWPLFPLALLHLKRGTRQDTVTAVSALQRYLRVHHSDLKAWLVLVEAYRRQGKYNAALRVAHHLNELNNNNNNNNKTSPLSYEVHYHIASINAKLGLLPDARVAFERCLQLLPPRPQHGEDPALSYRTLTLWGLSTVCLKLIQLAYRQGQMTRAWSLLVDTERLLSSHSISFSHVTFWKLFGDVCLHYFLFRVWFPTNMKNTDTTTTLRQMQLSHWQLILNKLSDGMKAYLRAIQYARDQPTLYYDVAVACVYIAQLLRQMEVMESDNVKRETAQQQRIKYLHEALSHVRDVLVLRPTSSLLRANAWNLKGFIHVLLNQFALAHHCFVVSYRVLPTRAASLRHIAAVLLHHNVPSDVTEQLLRKALSIEPTDACSWLALATTLETTPSNTSRSITSSTPFSLYSLYLSAYDLDNTLSEAVEGMARLTVVHYTSSKDNHNHSHLRSEHVTVGGESTLRIWDRRVLLGLIHLTQREPWRIESLHLLGLWYAREAQLQALQHTLRNPMTTDARIALLQLAIDTLQRAMNSLVEEEPELQSHYRTVLQMNLARVRTLLALSCGERSSIVEALHQWQMIRPVTSRHRLRTSLGLAATHFAARQFSEAATILRNLSLDTDINQLCNDLLVLCPLWLAKVSYFTSDSSFATLTTTLTHTSQFLDKVHPRVVHSFHAYKVLLGILFNKESFIIESLQQLRIATQTLHSTTVLEWSLLPEVLAVHHKWQQALSTSRNAQRTLHLSDAKLLLLQALHNAVLPLPHPLWHFLCSFLTHSASILSVDSRLSSESECLSSRLLGIVLVLLVNPHTHNPFVHNIPTLLTLIQTLQQLGRTEELHQKVSALVHEYPLCADGWWFLAISFFSLTFTRVATMTTSERRCSWLDVSRVLFKIIDILHHLQLDRTHFFVWSVSLLRSLSLLLVANKESTKESTRVLNDLRLTIKDNKETPLLRAYVSHFLALAQWTLSRTDFSPVITLLRQSLLEAPFSTQTWLTLAYVYTECGKFAAAEKCYVQCINLLEGSERSQGLSSLFSTALVHYALFAYRTRQFAKGLKLAERAFVETKHPSLWILISLCALALGRKNKISQAREVLSKLQPGPLTELATVVIPSLHLSTNKVL